MIPAVIEKDIENFGSALDSLQTLGFKKQEVSLQSQQVQDVIEQMRLAGTHGVGMSSFGPAICGFVENEIQGKRIVREMQKFLDENIGGKVLLTTPNNTGADIRMD
jgi:beta-ribofuranosylaminobenzene 5'-phosphate synthase